jgi:RNA polymerase sigma-70 factor (ECF subfamily)
LVRLGVQIARNLAVDHVRRARRLEREYEAEAEAGVVEPGVPDPLLRDVIQGCVERLPKQPATALACRLQNCGALPDETLAEQVGMQLNTFLKNFGRARQLLLECLARANVRLGERVEPG